ncbi:MAG: rhomboid family intramembrane serine protease [Desulfobacteraceae bacterium]
MTSRYKKRFSNLIQFVTALWIIEILNILVDHRLCNWGIYPRTTEGLMGIVFSPLLHTSIVHLVLNTGPIVVLGFLITLDSKALFWKTTFFITFLGGLLVWGFARSAYHVGASGLIFGYFGFLVFRGFFNLKVLSLVISFFTLFIYGGLFWQMLPTISRISWESHLCGFIAGILAAYNIRVNPQN